MQSQFAHRSPQRRREPPLTRLCSASAADGSVRMLNGAADRVSASGVNVARPTDVADWRQSAAAASMRKTSKNFSPSLFPPSLECCPDCHATCLAPCDTHCRPPVARSLFVTLLASYSILLVRLTLLAVLCPLSPSLARVFTCSSSRRTDAAFLSKNGRRGEQSSRC